MFIQILLLISLVAMVGTIMLICAGPEWMEKYEDMAIKGSLVAFQILFAIYHPVVGIPFLIFFVATYSYLRAWISKSEQDADMVQEAPALRTMMLITVIGFFYQIVETVCGRFF